jgi:O-antigen/teichoic acid export membrane protein
MGNTTINVSQLISNQFDLMVIAAFIDTRWVTFFYVARTICDYYKGVISAIVHTFTPHITHLDSRGERKAMVDFYLRVSRITAYVSTWLMVGLVAYGSPFVAFWIGEEYVTGDLYYRTDIVLYLLVSGLYFRTLQSMAWQVLLGSRQLAFLTRVNIAEAAANLGLSVLLVRSYGLAGVAVGTAIPMWIFYGAVMPIYMVRKYEIRWTRYFQVVLRPAAVTCVVFGSICWLAVNKWYPQTLWQLLVSAIVGSLLYGVFVVFVELKKEERSLIREKLSQLAPSRM